MNANLPVSLNAVDRVEILTLIDNYIDLFAAAFGNYQPSSAGKGGQYSG